jgi:hypothetical protein
LKVAVRNKRPSFDAIAGGSVVYVKRLDASILIMRSMLTK